MLLVPCLKASMWTGASSLPADLKARMASAARIAGSSIYPAVQNVILACRAFGLGTVLTTIHAFFEEEVRRILKLPAPETYALMPIVLSARPSLPSQAESGARNRLSRPVWQPMAV